LPLVVAIGEEIDYLVRQPYLPQNVWHSTIVGHLQANAIGFNAVAQASSSPTINQVTSAYTDVSNTFDPGGRIGQLMFRFNW